MAFQCRWVFVLLALALLLVGACAPETPLESAPGSDATWSSQVHERIVASGYAPQPVDGGFQAHNRAQGFDATLTEEGVRVGALAMSLRSWGREGTERQVERVPVREGDCGSQLNAAGECIHRLAYTRPAITEWWENRPDGLEQGFTLDAPSGVGTLVIEIAVDGAVVEGDGTAARIGNLRYSGLVAFDETGRDLPAWMEEADGGLRLLVDDAGAIGQITVDPVLTTATWTTESDQADAWFGYSVSSAGDVNGDGFGDVIVGAPTWGNGQTDEGGAFVYLGSATGLSTTASWTAESDQDGANLGLSVSSAGDVNGDGYGDVVMGANYFDNGQTDEGRAFLYLGSATGLSAAPSWTAEPDQDSAFFGHSVSSAGDVNGDGFGDVAVGADYFSNGQTYEGRAYLYLGSATGLSATSAWTAESNKADARFGFSVSAAGDVNGDGYGDVAVGSPTFDNGQAEEGRAYLYLGSASGLSTNAAWVTESNQAGAWYGNSASAASDVNGDGYGDLVIGTWAWDNGQTDEGRASLFLGSASGLASNPSWTAEADQASAHLGQSVSSGGDVNGDGYGDVVVGTENYDNGQTDEGRASLYLGSASGLATSPSWTAESNQANVYLGGSVSSAGDVNGDGLGDLVVGAPYYDNGQTDEGRAFLYLGSASILAATPSWTAESDQASATFGRSVSSAGDVNGDGFGDVVVGADYYSNGQTSEGAAFLYFGSASGLATTAAWTAESDMANTYFGTSVSSAGDVNGDGYGDVVVGAPYYDSLRGKIWLYLGSTSGLTGTACWTTQSDRPSYFGNSVSSAGDVNGDGYGDIVVGAWYYGNNYSENGATFVYHGSSSGFGTTASWTVQADQLYSYFGDSVSSAGDVNGDGYSDVVVGAYSYDNGQTDEGRTSLYLGSASGLATTASWTAESDQTYASFGKSVSSAGDVNGDGYGDVVVGAYYYANGQSNEGRAYLYLGSTSGLVATASWTAESDQADAYFGRAVSSAGDVNGDGYGDVVVGAYRYDNWQTDEGRTFLFLGSASGLSATAAWTTEPDVASTYFGRSVASAGDVNGDGYGDVMAGATYWTNGQTNEGRAYLYLGNGGDGTGPGLALAPQTRRPSTTTPVPPGLTSSSASAFDVTILTARGPWGRARVKTQVEAKPLGAAFDGADLVTQSTWTDSGLSGTEIQQAVEGLLQGSGYHWRARVMADPTQGMKQGWGPWKYGGLSGFARGGHVFTTGAASAWYRDADGDGFGAPSPTMVARGQPAGYAATSTDCNDTSASAHPGASEVCDETNIDEDCDGLADDADAIGASTWHRDADGDGYGDSTSTIAACDAPVGYIADAMDCDDAAATIHPGATEICDPADADEDCDGQADDATATGQATWYLDADGDGFGSSASITACNLPPGYAADSTDCDDTSAAIHPTAPEICDPSDQDEDCDGLADDADPSVSDRPTWYLDADADGYGDALGAATACDLPAGYASLPTDCDDIRPGVNPDATELCNALDDDCDGFADGPDAADATTWYLDADADGYGLDTTTQPSCTLPLGYVALGGDCNDANTAMHPGATEADCKDPNDYNCDGSVGATDIDADGFAACEDCDDRSAVLNPDAIETCNAIDDDCSGSVDDNAADAMTWYPDADVDFYGSAAEATVACVAPAGTILASESLGDDCDDGNPAVHPGAAEVCGKLDDDCDGAVDEAGATGEATWYADADQDGFANPKDTAIACTPPESYIAASKLWDCEDGDAAVNPDATEACNAIDDDCDGFIDEEGATGETLWYADTDGDGFGDATSTLADCEQPTGYVADASDCDDSDSSVYPGADEIPGDGIDQDCDGIDRVLDSGDSGPIVDSGPEPTDTGDKEGGCGGCASTRGSGVLAVILGLLGLLIRRRR